jgi:predicted acylesterase/phospholipase RssA
MPRQSDPAKRVDVDGWPAVAGPRRPLAMVYGGGGVFGIAYGMGVATGLREAGIPVHEAPALGTSAGSWVAGVLALGLTYEDLRGLPPTPVPTREPVLYRSASLLFGDAVRPLVAVSCVRLRTRRRHVFNGGRYPLADLVAASSAVPGLFPPHRIDHRRYIDGGMWSATSVDAAAHARQVIVVAPLAGSVLGPMGRSAGLLLARELRTWRERHPDASITLIRPNRAIARLAGRNPLGLFDNERSLQVFPLAREQGLRWGERLQLDAAA